MGNAYISNTIDLLDAITDCNNCSCDKEKNERCSRCDFCVIPNYVKMGCTDNTIIGEHILSKPVKLIRNPNAKRNKSRSKYTPPIMPAPIKIESSMTYNAYDNANDSSSMDRVIATIEPYPLPPTPSNSPMSDSPSDHYYIPGHGHHGHHDNLRSNSSSPSNGSSLTPLSTNYPFNHAHIKPYKDYQARNSPNSTSEFSTVDMNTSNDDEEVYKRHIQRAIIERNAFLISEENEINSNSSLSISDDNIPIPEEDVVVIERVNGKNVNKNKNKQKRNSLVPNFEEESDNDNDKGMKSNKKMRQFRTRHKDAMF